MSAPAFTSEYDVMFFDTDIGGVVHNAAYLRIIEICRTHLASNLGFDLASMGENRIFPVVVRTEIDYIKPATLGDRLEVRGALVSIEGIRFGCDFEVVRQSDSRLLAKCSQQLALVQMPQGRPLRLPADWKTRFPHLYAN